MAYFIIFPNEVPTMLSELANDSQARWGMMTPQHAVEHLLLVLNLSMGKTPLPVVVQTPVEKLPKYKATLMGEIPFPQDFKAPMLPQDNLLPLKYANLEATLGL